MIITDFWFKKKRIQVSCLTVLFDSPTFDDSLEAPKRKHLFFLLRLSKHLQIHLAVSK